jgi:hypothetical protein
MNSRRRGPFAALAAPILLTMVALGSLVAGVHPNRAAAADLDPNQFIKITMSTLTPIAPQPGEPLTITGRLINVSSETVTNLYTRLLVGAQLQSRGEFQQYAATSDPITAVYLTPSAVPGEPLSLAPGASEKYTLTIDDVSSLGLPEPYEVYQMAVAATGDTSIGFTTFDQLHTFLPWAPRDIQPASSTSLAWVVPLVDGPHRNADGTWFDDNLAPELAPGGRLFRILNAGIAAANQRPLGAQATTNNVALTWAIDPMLLSDVKSMESGYVVSQTSTQDGKVTVTRVPGKGRQAAIAWMNRLQMVVQRPGAEVIALPFADADVVAAVRAKLTTQVGLLVTSGRTIVAKDLPGAQVEPIAWPPGGMTNSHTADILTAAGNHSLVLDPEALPVIGGPPAETPSARTQFTTPSGTGTLDALLTDEGLNADIDAGPVNPIGLRASVQQFAAETLMIHAEDPHDARSLIVTPNRHWNPPPTYAAQLLEATGRLPWLTSVNLSTVADSPPWEDVQRETLQYPLSAKKRELPPDYLQQVANLGTEIAAYRAILPQDSHAADGLAVAQQQALSAYWRPKLPAASLRLAMLKATVAAQMRRVRITTNPNSYVTLTSHGGRIPVTVANNLPTDVTVKVRLLNNARLSGGSETTVKVPAGQQHSVTLEANAKTSGVFPVKVQLETLQNEPYGAPVPLFVRSTAYGTITLLITGAATAALMIAVVIRLTRRGLRARRSATGSA